MSYLIHYGILGMKWGNHRISSEKLKNIQKNKKSYHTDRERATYLQSHIAKRVGGQIARHIMGQIVKDVLTSNISNYGSMSKVDILKRVGSIIKGASISFGGNEVLARSAMSRYNDKGQLKDTSKKKGLNKYISREDYIELGINTAVRATQVAKIIGSIKMNQINRKNTMNEAQFKSWGKNILSEKFDNIVYSKGNMDIIDNR
jgi:hypothetical protein